MSSKRKRVVLSLADKIKIIEQLDKGVSGKHLADVYKVGTSTISDIKKNKSSIVNFVSVLENEDGSSSRKSMKTAENKELEEAVFKWFLQQRTLGNPLSGPIICEKATLFAEKMNSLGSFKASNGWLRNFKARQGIRELDLSGEKLSADPKAAENFIETFKIESASYDPEFVYNADETGLNWKALPKTTLASKRESSAPGHKVSKDRVTTLNCGNSTGNHRLPLLMIGKSKNPRAFKNVKKLPVIYKNQKKAWMTAALFTEWFHDVFIPEVKRYQKALGKEGSKVLLLLDNAPTHPTENLLEREDGRFRAMFLPPNVTSLLQPMDQSVIETMKRNYRRQLIRKLLLENEDEEGIVAQHKKINLKDCSYMVAEAWSMVKATTLRRAWNKLKGISTKEELQKEKEEQQRQKEEEEREEENDEVTVEEIRDIIINIPGCSECSAEDVGEWLSCDSTDPGFQILDDDELVQSVVTAGSDDL
uniref:HTH CENPB-type domain-containing protein n=1 Tax=Graphocephala atropunctata TaxID=36148 RepID=A0A1B6LJJ7_9HEMI